MASCKLAASWLQAGCNDFDGIDLFIREVGARLAFLRGGNGGFITHFLIASCAGSTCARAHFGLHFWMQMCAPYRTRVNNAKAASKSYPATAASIGA